MAICLIFKSFIHFQLSFVYKISLLFYSSSYANLVLLAPFIEETILFPLCPPGTLAKNLLTISVWIYFWAFYSLPLEFICYSASTTVFDYNFVNNLQLQSMILPTFSFFLNITLIIQSHASRQILRLSSFYFVRNAITIFKAVMLNPSVCICVYIYIYIWGVLLWVA